MAAPSEGTITDQALEQAIERKERSTRQRDRVPHRPAHQEYLPPTRETHWLNDPRRIPQSERDAFLKDLEAL